jgi:hypothetical protein
MFRAAVFDGEVPADFLPKEPLSSLPSRRGVGAAPGSHKAALSQTERRAAPESTASWKLGTQIGHTRD